MSRESKHRAVVAAFDFDGTITDRESLLPFLRSFCGTRSLFINGIKLLPYYALFLLGHLSRQRIKEHVISVFLAGIDSQTLKEQGRLYAAKNLKHYIRPKAIERLRWHQKRGDLCILISASLDFYLKPWAEHYQFDDLICSQLEISKEGIVTGRLQGTNCWGEEKVRRLIEQVGPKAQYYLYAYGDSRGDRELLELADEPFFRPF